MQICPVFARRLHLVKGQRNHEPEKMTHTFSGLSALNTFNNQFMVHLFTN